MNGDEVFERLSTPQKLSKAVILNPLVNYVLPRSVLKHLLHKSGSPLAVSSMEEPGGWRSMVIAYENAEPINLIDRMVMRMSSFPMGLRNRKRLSVKILRELMDQRREPTNLVAIGAGAAHNVQESMHLCVHNGISAYCIDLNPDAFELGRRKAESLGLSDRVHFIHGNALDIRKLVRVTPHLVVCIGILEYLTDEQIIDIFKVMNEASPKDAFLLANSISKAHGTDRFLRRVFNLHLHYRSQERVEELMVSAGYKPFRKEREPMGIYSIVVARKG